jgi:hypothetical protein
VGRGTLSATIEAPLLRVLTATSRLADTLDATTSGARVEALRTGTIDAFQVLRADQTRLVVVATVAGDSTRELWLSLPGVPAAGPPIALRDPTLDSARLGRAGVPFAMLRVIEQVTVGQTAVRQLWRSTGGTVELTNVVQTGPFGLCGWATGHLRFDAVGTDLADPSHPDLGTLSTAGDFETKFTVLAPYDTLVEPGTSTADALARLARLAAPRPEDTTPCAF